MRVGIRKKIDNLGRITIPISYRRSYGLVEGEEVSVIDTDEGVLIFNPNKKKEEDNCKQRRLDT